jgi:hypothetical protein
MNAPGSAQSLRARGGFAIVWRPLTIAASALSIISPASSAGADAVASYGWWTSANPGLVSGPIPTLVPTGNSDGVPSDVPPGGLEVEQLGGVVSYAAIAYDAPGGTAVLGLKLRIDQNAANVPGSKLQACPLRGDNGFADAQGDPIALGPPYDCAQSIPGVEAPDGTTVSFDVTRLAPSGHLGVAVVAAGTGRVVFDAPDQTTIIMSAAAPPEAPAPSDRNPTASVPPLSSAAPAPVNAPSPVQTLPVPSYNPPSLSPPAQATPANTVTASPTVPTVSATPATVMITEPSGSTSAGSAIVGFALALVVSAGVVRGNRRASRRTAS